MRQLIFRSAISSHATLAGEPRLGRVTQPGFRNKTVPCLSFRGTCVCPCNTASTSLGACAGGICWRRNFNPPRTRSTTSGHSKLVSQFPRTRVIRGPIAPSSSRILSTQTSPRCQISSASLAIWLTFSGKRLCVSARTKIPRRMWPSDGHFALRFNKRVIFQKPSTAPSFEFNCYGQATLPANMYVAAG